MNIIIRETSSEIRAIARNALKGNWKTVAMTMMLYYLLVTTLPLAIDELIPGAVFSSYSEALGENIEYPVVSTLYSLLLTGPFEVGLCSFLIYFVRRKEVQSGHLFDGFEHFVKSILLTFVIGFYVFCWSLLFIIPGLVAAFRYSQAYYILADHPELSVGECIRRSKEMMTGNKGKLFVLELTFIGWAILSGIPVAFLPDWSGVAYILADFLASIPYFFFLAYFSTGRAVFYELASGNLMARPAPLDPLTPPSEENQDIPKNEFDF